mgnify:FL=1
MNFQESSIIEKDIQEKLIRIIYDKHDIFKTTFSKMFILAEKKSNNEQKVISNLTPYYLKYGHSCLEDMNNSEYVYLNKIVIFDNDIIHIDNQDYKVEVASTDHNEMILKNINNKELVKINLNDYNNLKVLYKIFSFKLIK